ncbi:MAG: acetate--CoA ligase family protein [Acidimicrobiia bacterium]|nr:acetate--CoA ligase family protein [Acidimicrobiia bacterium]
MTTLDRLLDPATIAIAGLSADQAKHGGRVLGHLRRLGFPGTIWGVHPQVPDIEGVEMFGSLAALPHPPDLVISAVPAAAAGNVVAQAAGVGAVVVFAGGYGESGAEGRALEERLAAAAASAGTRLLGPNSGGVIRPGRGLAASFLTCLDRPGDETRRGPVGVVTQSGGIGSYLHNLAAGWGGGLAVSVSTGNEADIKLGEAIDAVSRLDDVQVVLALLETVRDGAVFIDAVKASIARGKPVVACRIGTGVRGRSLMTTHTGALAAPEAVLRGVLASLGVVVAETPGEALEVAEMMARAGSPAGDRVGIVTHSGGIAIHLADLSERQGLGLPAPGPELAGRLEPLLDHGVANNPLDMGGIIAGPARFAEVIEAFADSGDYDLVLAVSTAHPPRHSEERAASLLAMEAGTPILHLWMAGDQARGPLATLRSAGAPVTEDPRAAIRALAGLSRLASHEVRSAPDAIAGGPESWGVPFVAGEVATSADDAVAVAGRLGYPVVLKVVSPGLAHKTEAGGVKVDLATEVEVRAGFDEIVAATEDLEVEGIRVERFRPGLEVIVGAIVDDRFGPLVSIGLGGVLTELLDDVVFAPAPVHPEEALGMIDRLRGRDLLDGYRGTPPADVEGLADLVGVVSRGFVGSGLREIEINPLIWDGEAWVAVDWLWSP